MSLEDQTTKPGEGNTECEKFFVSKRALGLVQNVLRSIDEESKDDGPVALESLCFDGDRNFFVGLWEGQYGEVDIAVLKESRNLLSPILDAVDKRIRHLQIIKKCHIMKLPDEMLLTISKLAFLAPIVRHRFNSSVAMPHPYLPTHYILAAVNRRFRSILTSSPFFWTSISNKLTRPALKMYLQRCGQQALLDITADHSLKDGPCQPTASEFMQSMVEYAPRWRSFKFVLSYYRIKHSEEHPTFVPSLYRERLPRLRLPNLQSLELQYEVFPDQAEQISDVSDFYASWSMPHLCSLKCSHVLPRWEFNVTPAPPLKSLKVELHSDNYYCGLLVPLKPLKQLLQNTLSLVLEEMELMIPFFTPSEDENNVPAFANTILPFTSLKTLTLTIFFNAIPGNIFLATYRQLLHIIDSFRFPVLQTAIITIRWVDNTEDDYTSLYSDFLCRVAKMLQTSSALEDLNLNLNFEVSEIPEPPIWASPFSFVHNLKNLRHLRLRRMTNIPPLVPAGDTLIIPPLETIYLDYEAHDVTDQHVQMDIDTLRASSHLDELRRLVVTDQLTRQNIMERVKSQLKFSGMTLGWEPPPLHEHYF